MPTRHLPYMAALTLLAADPSGAGELSVNGALWARPLWTQGQSSWLEGGFGRLTEGASGPQDTDWTGRGQLHLGVTWTPSEEWRVRAHGVAQGEPSRYGGQRFGLVEAFAQYRPELTPALALRFRAGSFFPQTSLENVDPLWQSPYTLTLSALNTWTAEELRLTGLDAALVRRLPGGGSVELAGAAFGVNDTSGALLAWRGWTLGDRLTTHGERLPLPPLTTLAPGAAFGEQAEGTQPLDELDGRPGWQARASWTSPGGGGVRAAYLDNRGDRALHDGQYAWATRFATLGVELPIGALRVLAEGGQGSTGMGPALPGGPHVDVDFRAGYVMLSWSRGAWRASARFDAFDNRDRDGTAEPGQESGHAVTLAAFWTHGARLRLGAEYLELRAQRPAAATSGADPDTDARRALVELRLRF
jgi:hypothetical protein